MNTTASPGCAPIPSDKIARSALNELLALPRRKGIAIIGAAGTGKSYLESILTGTVSYTPTAPSEEQSFYRRRWQGTNFDILGTSREIPYEWEADYYIVLYCDSCELVKYNFLPADKRVMLSFHTFPGQSKGSFKSFGEFDTYIYGKVLNDIDEEPHAPSAVSNKENIPPPRLSPLDEDPDIQRHIERFEQLRVRKEVIDLEIAEIHFLCSARRARQKIQILEAGNSGH